MRIMINLNPFRSRKEAKKLMQREGKCRAEHLKFWLVRGEGVMCDECWCPICNEVRVVFGKEYDQGFSCPYESRVSAQREALESVIPLIEKAGPQFLGTDATDYLREAIVTLRKVEELMDCAPEGNRGSIVCMS